MLEPGNNEALKIETVRRRTGLIRQYPGMGPVEIVAYMAANALGFLRYCSNVQLTPHFAVRTLRMSHNGRGCVKTQNHKHRW